MLDYKNNYCFHQTFRLKYCIFGIFLILSTSAVKSLSLDQKLLGKETVSIEKQNILLERNENVLQLEYNFELQLGAKLAIDSTVKYDGLLKVNVSLKQSLYLEESSKIDEHIISLWFDHCDIDIYTGGQDQVTIIRKHFYMDDMCEIELSKAFLPLNISYHLPITYQSKKYLSTFHMTNILLNMNRLSLLRLNEISTFVPKFLFQFRSPINLEGISYNTNLKIGIFDDIYESLIPVNDVTTTTMLSTDSLVRGVLFSGCDPSPKNINDKLACICFKQNPQNTLSSEIHLHTFPRFFKNMSSKCKYLLLRYRRFINSENFHLIHNKYYLTVIIYEIIKICTLYFNFLILSKLLQHFENNGNTFKVLCLFVAIFFHVSFTITFSYVLDSLEAMTCTFLQSNYEKIEHIPIYLIMSIYPVVYLFIFLIPFKYFGILIDQKLKDSKKICESDLEEELKGANLGDSNTNFVIWICCAILDKFLIFSVHCMQVLEWAIISLNFTLGLHLMMNSGTTIHLPILQFFLGVLFVTVYKKLERE